MPDIRPRIVVTRPGKDYPGGLWLNTYQAPQGIVSSGFLCEVMKYEGNDADVALIAAAPGLARTVIVQAEEIKGLNIDVAHLDRQNVGLKGQLQLLRRDYERLHEKLSSFELTVAEVKIDNTPEFMEYLAQRRAEVRALLGAQQ